jgi:hypothetical protein
MREARYAYYVSCFGGGSGSLANGATHPEIELKID